MKALILLLFTIISFNLYSQSGYKYEIKVPTEYISKNILEDITRNIPNNGRYIKEYGYDIYTMSKLDTTKLHLNIPAISITEYKKDIYIPEKAGGTNCETAELLCSNTSQTANSSGAGTQELNSSNRGCLSTEHQSSWYYINVQTGGSLTMTIDPQNNSDDYDFAIWGPFTAATANANCPPVSSPIRCSYSACEDQTGIGSGIGCYSCWLVLTCYGSVTGTGSSEGGGGDSWVSALTVSANQVYILLVDNFSNSGQPYNLSFGGTATLGCTPIVLDIELIDFSVKNYNRYNRLSFTVKEKDNDYFILERLSDNYIWETIEEIKSIGNGQNSYIYDDYSYTNTDNYYRLVGVDVNGNRKEYKTLYINNNIDIKIIKRINLLGQEVDENYKGVIIEIYNNNNKIKTIK